MSPVIRHSRLCALLILMSCILAGLPRMAAAQSPTGSIEGTIVDASGAVLPGVTVTLVQADTKITRVAVSDGNGLFNAPLLPVGVYT